MKRIGILFEYPTLNGGERSMLAAIDAMETDQFEFVAIAPPEGMLADELTARCLEHVPLQVFDENRRRLPRDQVVAALLETVGPLGLDLLHANSLSMGVITGALEDVEFTRFSHIRDMMSLSKNVVRLLNQNDQLVAVSQATSDYHVAQGVQDERLTVLHNGVDCEVFRPNAYPRTLRGELGLPEESLLTLTVGQIGLRKGLEVLTAAICSVAETLPSLSFLIAGERSSSKQESIDYEASLHERIDTNGLADRVHWLGYRTDIARLMNEADMLIHTAHQEPLGRVLLEAAASGLAIIATDVGGTSEIVHDDASALLIEEGDVPGLANAIGRLAKSEAERTILSSNARARAVQAFADSDAAMGLARLWLDG